MGMDLNIRERAAMNAALLKAQGEDSNKVTMENDHTASVQSRSHERLYTVSLPQDASAETPTCTCQAGVHRKMCWHVAKVLQLLGHSEHALLRHMGLFRGGTQGDYWQLKAATDREVRAVADDLQQGTHQQASSNISDAELPKERRAHTQPRLASAACRLRQLLTAQEGGSGCAGKICCMQG